MNTNLFNNLELERSSEPQEDRGNKEKIPFWFIVITAVLFCTTVAFATAFGFYYIKYNDQTCSSTYDNFIDYEWNTTEVTDPLLSGRWETVIPGGNSSAYGNIIGIQTVHSALLPSGKIILASGSSWRNYVSQTQVYPEYPQPAAFTGLFNKNDNPFEWEKNESYYEIVNNVGIYNPNANTFYRMPHPLPNQPDPDNSSWFLPTDLFCTSHMHLCDGNILFFGGTQFYKPQRTGTKTTFIFNWTMEASIDWRNFDWTKQPEESSEYYPWHWSGYMKQGRWYAHAVPLLDGRFAIFGGYIGFDSLVPDMYSFEMNTRVEFFDYAVYLNDTSNPQAAWFNIDVQNMTRSPFNTNLTEWAPEATNPSAIPRQQEAYKKDSFKLYPENYLLPDGRIYMTREGDFNSLRTVNATCIRRTKFTYFLHINGTTEKDTNISFSMGPERPENITMSGTTVLDPNRNNEVIMLFGGMNITTGGTLKPGLVAQTQELPDFQITSNGNHYVGSRGSRKLEEYKLPSSSRDIGSWNMIDSEYLGEYSSDDRTMHYAIILPTKQILIVNGGNYDFGDPVHSPLLLTPEYDNSGFTGSYTRTKLAPSSQPRLYHNIALLLRDGRVFSSGGNACRASVNTAEPQGMSSEPQSPPNLNRVELSLYFTSDSSVGYSLTQPPAENWVAEIFSPPYLFIDGSRRASIDQVSWIPLSTDKYRPSSYTLQSQLEGEDYYLFHSLYEYELTISSLPLESECAGGDPQFQPGGSLVIMKLGTSTHGWDAGQRLYGIPFTLTQSSSSSTGTVTFQMPNAIESNMAPAYYMLYYVDCRGKPSESLMVRFDDAANKAI